MLTGQLVDAGTVSADLNGFAAVALRWRHDRIPPPSCKPLPRSGMAFGGSSAGTNRSAGLRLQSVEKRFRVGVVVADPWSGEGSEHTKLL